MSGEVKVTVLTAPQTFYIQAMADIQQITAPLTPPTDLGDRPTG